MVDCCKEPASWAYTWSTAIDAIKRSQIQLDGTMGLGSRDTLPGSQSDDPILPGPLGGGKQPRGISRAWARVAGMSFPHPPFAFGSRASVAHRCRAEAVLMLSFVAE